MTVIYPVFYADAKQIIVVVSIRRRCQRKSPRLTFGGFFYPDRSNYFGSARLTSEYTTSYSTCRLSLTVSLFGLL